MFQLPVFQYNTLTDFLKTTGWIGCVYWEEQDFIRLLCTIKVSRVIISLNQTMIRARMYLWYVYACVQLISISHYRQTWNITILHTVLLCTNKSDFWLALNSLVPNITKNSTLIQFIVTNPFLCEQGKAEKWRCELGTTKENFWIQFQVYHNLCSFVKWAGSSRSLSTKIVHGFTPLPVHNQYIKQGMGWRRSVAEDATGVVLIVSPEMTASPSTCRVSSVVWQVRGMYCYL